MIKTFLLEPTGLSRSHLRRYSSGSTCPGKYSYHNADGLHLGDFKQTEKPDGTIDGYEGLPVIAPDDPRYPIKCDHCEYLFTPGDNRHVFSESLYKRTDTGEIITLRSAPAGAIWRATWLEGSNGYVGPDGKTYICRLPGNHDWIIDSIASNCPVVCTTCGRTYAQHSEPGAECRSYKPIDGYQHKCWCRTGEAPNFDVGKNGPTCSAGAGSILVPNWHGFLRNGFLVE